MGLLIFLKEKLHFKKNITISQASSCHIPGPWDSSRQFWLKKRNEKDPEKEAFHTDIQESK